MEKEPIGEAGHPGGAEVIPLWGGTWSPPRSDWATSEARKVFVLFMPDDSMWPRFKRGDVLLIHEGRIPNPGDDVLVQYNGPDGKPSLFLEVALLVHASPGIVVLRKHSPHEYQRRDPAEIHRMFPVLDINAQLEIGEALIARARLIVVDTKEPEHEADE